MSEEKRSERTGPWWQRRLATARGSITFAVFSIVMGVAWLMVFAPQVLDGGSSGWRVVLVVAVPVGWACFAAAYAAGGLAQRRQESVAG